MTVITVETQLTSIIKISSDNSDYCQFTIQLAGDLLFPCQISREKITEYVNQNSIISIGASVIVHGEMLAVPSQLQDGHGTIINSSFTYIEVKSVENKTRYQHCNKKRKVIVLDQDEKESINCSNRRNDNKNHNTTRLLSSMSIIPGDEYCDISIKTFESYMTSLYGIKSLVEDFFTEQYNSDPRLMHNKQLYMDCTVRLKNIQKRMSPLYNLGWRIMMKGEFNESTVNLFVNEVKIIIGYLNDISDKFEYSPLPDLLMCFLNKIPLPTSIYKYHLKYHQ